MERGHTLRELPFVWLRAKQPIASGVAGVRKPEQVGANVAAGWRLSEEDLAGLAEL